MVKPLRLQAAYRRYNKALFGGQLPDGMVVAWKRDMSKTLVGVWHNPGMIWESLFLKYDKTEVERFAAKCNKKFFIVISSRLKPFPHYARLVLLHEMTHVFVDLVLGSRDEKHHGPQFQKQMMRLARSGALEDLW